MHKVTRRHLEEKEAMYSICESSVAVFCRIESSHRQSKMDGQHLVTTEWIYACVEAGKYLEERHYMPKLIALE